MDTYIKVRFIDGPNTPTSGVVVTRSEYEQGVYKDDRWFERSPEFETWEEAYDYVFVQ